MIMKIFVMMKLTLFIQNKEQISKVMNEKISTDLELNFAQFFQEINIKYFLNQSFIFKFPHTCWQVFDCSG